VPVQCKYSASTVLPGNLAVPSRYSRGSGPPSCGEPSARAVRHSSGVGPNAINAVRSGGRGKGTKKGHEEGAGRSRHAHRSHPSGRQSSARASARRSVHAWAGWCRPRWSARACPSARMSALRSEAHNKPFIYEICIHMHYIHTDINISWGGEGRGGEGRGGQQRGAEGRGLALSVWECERRSACVGESRVCPCEPRHLL
jgi:hypothetical protein